MSDNLNNDIFVEQLKAAIRPLNELLYTLHGTGLQKFIELPAIVVVGEQSTGKSSVLESIVGEDFLPKSDELATRLPIILQLVSERDVDSDFQSYALLKGKEYSSGVKFTDERCTLRELSGKIHERTNLIAGENYQIVNEPIYVEIHSTSCPDLTLIDLPGIARNPREGSDQPENIEEITQKLIKEHIDKDQAVILAVIAANGDIQSSGALKMARQCDPEGARTLGVLTKIDIMDKGTNARKLLEGKIVNLKLGYVGVKNRSQDDINRGKTVREAVAEELPFFRTHPVYKDMPREYFGAQNLAVKLMQILKTRISACLPQIIADVNSRREKVLQQLERLGEGIPEDERQQKAVANKMVRDFVDGLHAILTAKFDKMPDEFRQKVLDPEPFGAAYLKQLFTTKYVPAVEELDISQYTHEAIIRTLTNTMANDLDFLPFSAFEILLTPYLKKVTPLAKNCLEDVHQYVQDLAKQVAKTIFKNFPYFLHEVAKKTEEEISLLKKDTAKEIDHFMRTQECIFTVHDAYCKKYEANVLANGMQNGVKNISLFDTQPTEIIRMAQSGISNGNQSYRDEDMMRQHAAEMHRRLCFYHNKVFKPIVKDVIPQTIRTYLVADIQNNLMDSLGGLVYGNHARLLQEPSERKRERDIAQKEYEVLTKANSHLSNFTFARDM